MTHFHVYIECSNIKLLPLFKSHNIQKTKPNHISPTEPVGLPKMLNHKSDTTQQAKKNKEQSSSLRISVILIIAQQCKDSAFWTKILMKL